MAPRSKTRFFAIFLSLAIAGSSLPSSACDFICFYRSPCHSHFVGSSEGRKASSASSRPEMGRRHCESNNVERKQDVASAPIVAHGRTLTPVECKAGGCGRIVSAAVPNSAFELSYLRLPLLIQAGCSPSSTPSDEYSHRPRLDSGPPSSALPLRI